MTLTFSRRLALFYGVVLPMVETIRRWQQLGDPRMWPAWLDDFVLGACLLYGAWRTSRDLETGRPWLAAAWGLTCGMAYTSFFGQLARLDQPDPSSLPAGGSWVSRESDSCWRLLPWRAACGRLAKSRAEA